MWFEIQGLPAVSIASSEFDEAADVQRRALGMDGARYVLVNHPIQDATDDEMLLQTVASTSPGMLGAYQTDIQNVNAYIRDAEQSVKNNPNDEEAQQYLMSAYEQRNMVYEMAMDRSLP